MAPPGVFGPILAAPPATVKAALDAPVIGHSRGCGTAARGCGGGSIRPAQARAPQALRRSAAGVPHMVQLPSPPKTDRIHAPETPPASPAPPAGEVRRATQAYFAFITFPVAAERLA